MTNNTCSLSTVRKRNAVVYTTAGLAGLVSFGLGYATGVGLENSFLDNHKAAFLGIGAGVFGAIATGLIVHRALPCRR